MVLTSVLQQVEQGKIDLTKDVTKYFPNHEIQLEQKVTMLDLMHHRGGFEDILVGLFDNPDKKMKPLLQVLQETQPEQIYPPGEITSYSNWGTALAAYVVECTSGKTFYDYVQQNIFISLKMTHTALRPDLADNQWVKKQRNQMQGYTSNGQLIKNNRRSIPLYPAGMATGTLDDLQRFVDGLLQIDSGLFEKEQTYRDLFSASIYYDKMENFPYIAHGFWAHYFEDGIYYGHGGNTASQTSYVLLNPQTKSSLIIMTNQKNETVYTGDLPVKLLGQYAFDKQVDSPSSESYHLFSARNKINHSFTPLMLLLSGTSFSVKDNQLALYDYQADKIADDLYLLDGIIYQVTKDSAENVKITTNYTDYIEIEKSAIYTSYALLAIWGIVIVLAVGLLVAILIKRVKSLKRILSLLLLLAGVVGCGVLIKH